MTHTPKKCYAPFVLKPNNECEIMQRPTTSHDYWKPWFAIGWEDFMIE